MKKLTLILFLGMSLLAKQPVPAPVMEQTFTGVTQDQTYVVLMQTLADFSIFA